MIEFTLTFHLCKTSTPIIISGAYMNERFYFTEHNTQIVIYLSSVASVRSVGCFVYISLLVEHLSTVLYSPYIVTQTTTCMEERAVYHFGK